MQVEVEPQPEVQPARNSLMDGGAPGTEGRQRRFGDMGHLLPISGNSRNVQVCYATHQERYPIMP